MSKEQNTEIQICASCKKEIAQADKPLEISLELEINADQAGEIFVRGASTIEGQRAIIKALNVDQKSKGRMPG